MPAIVPKILFISTLALFAGGIVAGTTLFPNIKEKKSDLKTQLDSNLIAESSTSSSSVESLPQSCTIYVAEEPKDSKTVNRKFEKLLNKFVSPEEFFRANLDANTNTTFKDDVEKACKGLNSKKNVNGSVYVWYGATSGGKGWIYSVGMHIKDWASDPEVIKEGTAK